MITNITKNSFIVLHKETFLGISFFLVIVNKEFPDTKIKITKFWCIQHQLPENENKFGW